MPVVTTLHTVLREPNQAQRKVMDELVRRSDRVVVMARKGAEILRETYGVSDEKVDIIPHGIPDMPFMDSGFYKAQFGVEGLVQNVTATVSTLGQNGDWLGAKNPQALSLTGRDAVQVSRGRPVNLDELARAVGSATTQRNAYLVRWVDGELTGTCFSDGRVLVQGTGDAMRAKGFADRWLG